MPHRLTITLSETAQSGNETSLLAVDRVVSDLRRGQIVLIEGENKGLTLAMAAEGATPQRLEKMQAYAGQAARLLLTARRVESLGLGKSENPAVFVSLNEEMTPDWIEALANPLASFKAEDKDKIIRQDAELKSGENAAIGLAKLARLLPACFTVRFNPDLCPPEGRSWALEQGLTFVKADDVFSYEEKAAYSLRVVSDAKVPLEQAADTKIVAFRPADGGAEHFAIIIGDPKPEDPALIRIHSECFTGDLLGSLRCDCGDQLRGGIQNIADQGSGILLYLAQEGRGIGLVNKLRAYKLQDSGHDTFDANELLGFEADERVYLPAAQMLTQLGINKVRLLTNNPEKVRVLQACGVDVVERVQHAFPSNTHNEPYIFAKATKGGHYL